VTHATLGALRRADAPSGQHRDIRLKQETLTVQNGKGGKTAIVAISGSLAVALAEYQGTWPGADYVLPYRARSTAWKHLKTLCAAAGVEFKGVHSLRHTAGTSIVASGLSLEDAAQQLRHANIQTTRSYTKWSNKRLKEYMSER